MEMLKITIDAHVVITEGIISIQIGRSLCFSFTPEESAELLEAKKQDKEAFRAVLGQFALRVARRCNDVMSESVESLQMAIQGRQYADVLLVTAEEGLIETACRLGAAKRNLKSYFTDPK